MLAKPNRLRKFRDFSRVYRQGRRFRSTCLTLCVCERSPDAIDQPIRIGITVGHKVSKRAVIRNQIKRRIRSVCRACLSDFRTGVDVVITVGSAATQCKYSEFLQQLTQLFTKAEILHGN